MPRQDTFTWWAAAGCIFFGASLGVVFTLASFTNPSSGEPLLQMSEVDLVVIVLTALSVILTALGVLFGVLAFIGFSSIKSIVERKAELHIQEGFQNDGPYQRLLRNEILKGASLKDNIPEEDNGWDR